MRKDDAQTSQDSRRKASTERPPAAKTVSKPVVETATANAGAAPAAAERTGLPARGLRATVLRDLLTELTLRERLVLGLRYVDELTVVEIAAVLEVAATEVERILESVAERVRRKLKPTYGRPSLA